MTRQEMEQLLSSVLQREAIPLDPPSVADWNSVANQFGCKFDNDFRLFIEVMSAFHFPGDVFNVSSGRTNGNDTITLVYDMEMQNGLWDQDMIPFYGIGNGDYFCLNRDECPYSPVYYYYADKNVFDKYSSTFEEWVKDLPKFLA